jgi:hypothetical protein
MFNQINEIRALATKYSKQELSNMARMGMIEPQKAVMAGMMIDRIAKSAMQPPQTTVAEDVLTPPMPAPGGMPPQGVMGAPSAPPPSAGVAGLPSGIQNMAGGGIVAFADGGTTPEEYVRASRGLDQILQPQPDMPVLPGGYRLRETALPERSNIATEIGAVGEAERAAGYDPDMYKRMREEEIGRKDELAKRKEEAKGEAILAAGLGLMGARKGQEFEVFGKAATQALAQYKGDVADIRKSENEIRKAARDLEMAENAAKKSKSEKALERVQKKQEAYDAAATHRDDLFNQTQVKLADMFEHQLGIDKQTASQMAVAKLNSETQIKTAGMHEVGAMARAKMPGEQERVINNMLADLRKKNPDATYADAVQAVKSSGTTSAASLADKAYDNVMKRAQVDMAFQMQINKDPAALQAAIDAETRRLQGGGARATPSNAPSGQIDTSNPLLR